MYGKHFINLSCFYYLLLLTISMIFVSRSLILNDIFQTQLLLKAQAIRQNKVKLLMQRELQGILKSCMISSSISFTWTLPASNYIAQNQHFIRRSLQSFLVLISWLCYPNP